MQVGIVVVPIVTPVQFDYGRFFEAQSKFHDATRLDTTITGIRFISGEGEFDLITSGVVELVTPGIYYRVPAAQFYERVLPIDDGIGYRATMYRCSTIRYQ